MSIDLGDYQTRIREAVKAFWGNRKAGRQKQIESGKSELTAEGSERAPQARQRPLCERGACSGRNCGR